MTEDEAKTKWCPVARVVMDGSDNKVVGPFNRDHWITDETLEDTINRSCCIASACMAWRTFRGSSINPDATGGYCGLAGKL